jgi:hypothetical protein
MRFLLSLIKGILALNEWTNISGGDSVHLQSKRWTKLRSTDIVLSNTPASWSTGFLEKKVLFQLAL